MGLPGPGEPCTGCWLVAVARPRPAPTWARPLILSAVAGQRLGPVVVMFKDDIYIHIFVEV